MGLAKTNKQYKSNNYYTKKALCFCVLMVVFWGCAAGNNDGKKVSVSVGKVPPTIIEALDNCLEDCINEHCAGEKLVLFANGEMEPFDTDNLTDDICKEQADLAIKAKKIIASKLGKLGGTNVPDPGAVKIKGGPFDPDTAHPGEGYFWAVEYIQCREKCLDLFRLSVLE